jgi:hypothetical protein
MNLYKIRGGVQDISAPLLSVGRSTGGAQGGKQKLLQSTILQHSGDLSLSKACSLVCFVAKMTEDQGAGVVEGAQEGGIAEETSRHQSIEQLALTYHITRQ